MTGEGISVAGGAASPYSREWTSPAALGSVDAASFRSDWERLTAAVSQTGDAVDVSERLRPDHYVEAWRSQTSTRRTSTWRPPP